MNKKIPEFVTELSIRFPDSKHLVIGLFEKHVDLLHVIRSIENNNNMYHLEIVQKTIYNPKLIDISFKKRVF